MFAQRLKDLREERQLTQYELAERVGSTQQAVAKWETGRTFPRKAKLEKLAALFDVPIDTFYDKPTSEEVPSEPRALESVIRDEALSYNGNPLTDDDREKIRRALELAFWDNDSGKRKPAPHKKGGVSKLPENAEVLTVAEKDLLHKYRALTDDQRGAIKNQIDYFYTKSISEDSAKDGAS